MFSDFISFSYKVLYSMAYFSSVFVVLVVIAAFVGASFCLLALRKNSMSGAHQQLPTESSHSLFRTGESSSEHGGAMEDGRATNPSNKPSGLSTERVKGLLAKSASFLKDRVGRKSHSRGTGSKPTAPKDSKADKSSGYAAVRSPFSIGGDEDGDDEDGFHDDSNADDIRV